AAGEQLLEQARRPRREPAQRLAHIEEHHRRRLLRRAALERVEPCDRRGVLGVAGEPVDGVRGEDGHAARGDAAAELVAHRRATSTRSIPARSRRRSTAPKPAARSRDSTASPWWPAISRARNATGAVTRRRM